MKVYNTKRGILATTEERIWHLLDVSNWDALVCSSDLQTYVRNSFRSPAIAPPAPEEILAPIGTQEVWAAGVTYFRSRNARIEESKDAGGGTFYKIFGSIEKAIGSPYKMSDGTRIQVVGVAEDGKYSTLTEDPHPAMFLPVLQFPSNAAWMVVRSTHDPQQAWDGHPGHSAPTGCRTTSHG